MSGDGARVSWRTSSASETTLVANKPPSRGNVLRSTCWTCSSVRSVVVTKMVNNASPIGSGRQFDLPGMMFSRFRVSSTATSPIGTLIRNTDFHPKCSVK